jgi:hypothetical protein
MKIRQNPIFPTTPIELVRELSVLWRELATSLNSLLEAFDGTGTSGNSNRWGSGVDTTDDVIIDDSDSGLVLRSPDGDYWRIQITNAGALTTTNLGTTKP